VYFENKFNALIARFGVSKEDLDALERETDVNSNVKQHHQYR
jgi:hypothetical protein